jgi:hypothetical protein
VIHIGGKLMAQNVFDDNRSRSVKSAAETVDRLKPLRSSRSSIWAG